MADDPSPFGRRPAPPPAALLDEIAAKASAIAASDAASAGPLWGPLHKLLLKAKVDPQVILGLVANRESGRLEPLVRFLRGEEVAVEVAPPKLTPPPGVDLETQRSAMKAFRRRLRLARLDAESRLGVGPLSGGKRHEIDAIVPPREFPVAVWEALVSAGRLRREGGGFYALVRDDVDDP